MSQVRRYWRDRARWMTIADVFAVLAALTLPWSTSLVAIFVVCWLVAVAWVMDWRAYARLLKQPICYLPLSLVGLAVIGTLWSDAAWGCAALRHQSHRQAPGAARAVLSFRAVVARDVGLRRIPGVVHPADADVVDRRDRSQPFAQGLRANREGAASLSRITSRRARSLRCARWRWPIRSSVCCGRTGCGRRWCWARSRSDFAVNMAFVIVSRTAMVTIPIMLAVFALLHLKWRTSLMIFGALVVMGGIGSGAIAAIAAEATAAFSPSISATRRKMLATSIGLRLEFWKKSLGFFRRGADRRTRHRFNSRLIRAGSHGNIDSATRRGYRQSTQPDIERRRAVGYYRGHPACTRCGSRICCCFVARGWSPGSDCWSWCRTSSPRCSTRTSSISMKDGCTCSASASPAAWCWLPNSESFR